MYVESMTKEKKEYPAAVDAPNTDVVPLTLTMVGKLLVMARESPRKRVIQRIHKQDSEGVHRMFNAMQPGTYIMPHRHLNPKKTETIVVISGAVLYVEFEESGEYRSHTLLQPGTESFGIDVAPHVYHTYVVLKPDTIMFEVKEGPYSPGSDKDIPDWAPREGSPEAEPYLLEMIKHLADLATAAAEKAEIAEKKDTAEKKEATEKKDADDEAAGENSKEQ